MPKQNKGRKDKQAKRRVPLAPEQSKVSEPIPKKIKNNEKEAIAQRTTEKEENDFRTESMLALDKLQLSPHFIKIYYRYGERNYSLRKPLFETIPKYLFPLISQKRHKYFESLKSIDFDLVFNRYDEKERSLINECFIQFSLLPYLRKLDFSFSFGIDETTCNTHHLDDSTYAL